jgi:WXG100 family type VII secretion target
MTAGTGFQVDPVHLRSASPQFDTAADQLEDARTALETALAAEGPCWGGDNAGQAFARNYLPQAEATTTAVATIVKALRAIRMGLDASADTWENCDQGAADRLGGRRQR